MSVKGRTSGGGQKKGQWWPVERHSCWGGGQRQEDSRVGGFVLKRTGAGLSCLLGIGSVSHHVVSGPSSQVLNGTVAELFIPFLQQEGNSVQCGEDQSGLVLAPVFTVGACHEPLLGARLPTASLLLLPCTPACFPCCWLRFDTGPRCRADWTSASRPSSRRHLGARRLCPGPLV